MNRNAYVLLLLTTLFWGGNAVAGKLAVGHVSPMLLTSARWTFALIILVAIGWRQFRADWPLLIGGLADKAKASAELPILDQVRAFPTTIFLNERNEVVQVHSGFVGPAGRGDHLEQQRAFEAIIDELLAE